MKTEVKTLIESLSKGEETQITSEQADQVLELMLEDHTLRDNYTMVEDNGEAGKIYFITRIL